MKRSIKFRVWDTTLNKMLYNGGLTVSNNEITDLLGEPMQFTGLLDRNGKECFEGDIIQDGKSIGVVVFKEGEFKIDWITNPEFWNDILKYHCNQIIGNQFSNPELLK